MIAPVSPLFAELEVDVPLISTKVMLPNVAAERKFVYIFVTYY